LQAWIRGGQQLQGEIRDPGLLKLYFGGTVTRADVIALAKAEEAVHADRLAEYQRILPRIENKGHGAFGLATLRLGLLHEQVAVDFWRDIANNPPEA